MASIPRNEIQPPAQVVVLPPEQPPQPAAQDQPLREELQQEVPNGNAVEAGNQDDVIPAHDAPGEQLSNVEVWVNVHLFTVHYLLSQNFNGFLPSLFIRFSYVLFRL